MVRKRDRNPSCSWNHHHLHRKRSQMGLGRRKKYLVASKTMVLVLES
jgi:hypothetical protein